MSGKQGYCHLVLGGTGTGKTTYVKERIKKAGGSGIIYDVQNEYKEFKGATFDPEISNFIKTLEKQKGSLAVIEEATMFLNNRHYNNDFEKLLVSKRHNRMYYLLCFHSFRNIPLYIKDLTNFITIGKTNDILEIVEQKFRGMPTVIEAFQRVQAHPDRFYKETIKLL